MPSVSFSKSQEKKIVKLFIQDRMSTPAIGRLYGVSHNHIMSVIKSSGVQYSLGERRSKFFTDRQRADIVKMYAGGLGNNTQFIGEKYRCSYATIRRILKEEGVFNADVNAKKRITFSEKDAKSILEKYAAGASANSLSESYSCSQSLMLAFLRRNGINTNDYGRGKNPRISDQGFIKTCRRLSFKLYRKHRQYVNPDQLSKRDLNLHLDHILSVSDGYAQGLTIFDLAHPCNLRLLPALDNLCKYKKSDQTKQELLRKIRSWNKEKGDPYQGLNIEVKYQYKYGRYRLVD